MPLSRAPRPPDLERVVQILGGEQAAGSPRRAGWVPAPPGRAAPSRVQARDTKRLEPGFGEPAGPDDADLFGEVDPLDDLDTLDAELRRARRPALLTVPESIRTSRVSVPSAAVVAMLALVVALGCAFVVRILWAERTSVQDRDERAPTQVQTRPGAAPTAVGTTGPTPSSGAVALGTGGATEVVVHVVGQVLRPGLVRLRGGARVADAIAAAGGARSGADVAALNLARVVVDGEQVHVPKPGEVVLPPGGLGGTAGPRAGAGGATAGGAQGVVNLNSADLTALDTLPGVGPVLAQRIIDWRAEHGRFTSIDELGEVSGIGDKLMSQLRSKVTV